MNSFQNLSAGVWAGLIGTPLLIAVGQVMFKLSSASLGEGSVKGLLQLAANPVFVAAIVLYGIGTLIWIVTLKYVPLTIAYSFMGLTYCFVPLLAQYYLGEALTLRYGLGALLIVGGLMVVNS